MAFIDVIHLDDAILIGVCEKSIISHVHIYVAFLFTPDSAISRELREPVPEIFNPSSFFYHHPSVFYLGIFNGSHEYVLHREERVRCYSKLRNSVLQSKRHSIAV